MDNVNREIARLEKRGGVVKIKNNARCRKCGDEIESKSRHDFVTCKCGAISVDGGQDYMRRCGNPEDFLPVKRLNEAAIAKAFDEYYKVLKEHRASLFQRFE